MHCCITVYSNQLFKRFGFLEIKSAQPETLPDTASGVLPLWKWWHTAAAKPSVASKNLGCNSNLINCWSIAATCSLEAFLVSRYQSIEFLIVAVAAHDNKILRKVLLPFKTWIFMLPVEGTFRSSVVKSCLAWLLSKRWRCKQRIRQRCNFISKAIITDRSSRWRTHVYK